MEGLDDAVTGGNDEEAGEEVADEGAAAADATQDAAEHDGDVINSTFIQKKYRKGSGKDVIAFGQPLSANDRARIWRMYSRLEHFMASRKSRGGMTSHSQRINAIKYLAGYSESSADKIVAAEHKKQKEEERRIEEEMAALPPEPIEVPRAYIRAFGQPSSLAVSLAQDVTHLAELDAAARLAVDDRRLLGVQQAPLIASDLILPSTSASTSHPRITDPDGNCYDILSQFFVFPSATESNDACGRGRGRPKGPTRKKSGKKKRQPSFNKKKGIRTSLTSQRAAGLLPPIEAPQAPKAVVLDKCPQPPVVLVANEGVPGEQDGASAPSGSLPTEAVASTSADAAQSGVGTALVDGKRKRGRPLGSSKKKRLAAAAASCAVNADGVVQQKRGRGRPPGSGKKKATEEERLTASSLKRGEKRGPGRPRGSSTSVGRRAEALPEIDGRKMSLWERALLDPLMVSQQTAPSVISSLMDTSARRRRNRQGVMAAVDDDDEEEDEVVEWGSYNVTLMNAAMYADSLASCTFLPT